ncbi:hypothetical protein B7P43_G05316 [Cryptotermes secundus]|uniref:DUF4766 domain-containing protein n=1 Tax=Cryptotermes secundus TaxID=105785 RepID=A0A2J7QF91_9NEOP|nr:uncharacterized protein LOC111867930 isoform X1 [Cryptotermes secundus]PNF27259.1 hypothetical protein B7P43_G05316 [Cryptotermes secundus]PNF27261.1 hypothetical protein B7P43_G05316 [Cryptotermes secundus]
MEFSGFSFCVSFMLIAFSAVAKAIQVSPKVDFGDTSPGINPDDIKVFIEKEKTSVNPGVVKAVLEVKVGESIVTDKYPAKSDKKEHKNTTKTNILICSLEGDCKLHEFNTDLSEDDEKEGDTKELKPIIVTDFDEDPLKGNNDDDDHNDGKKNPNIPVIVGYRGAVKDDGFYYTGHSNGQGIDRLPTYYGTTLRPGFHQPYPGPNIYGEVPRPPPPPRPGFNYGSYHPTYPHHDLRCVYRHYEGQRYPISDIPGYTGVRPYGHTSFPGYGPRTPSPYGHLHPTRKPGSFHAIITPLGRGNGVGGLDTPTVRGIVAVHGKVDFDEDDINVGVIGPLYPSSGNGNVKVDGKLGEPLHKSDP